MLRDEIEIAIVENISTFVHGKESAAAADAVLALFKERLGSEEVIEAVAEELGKLDIIWERIGKTRPAGAATLNSIIKELERKS